MNGAESLIRTLVDGGVTVAFTNPGTSEMHFVAAVDRVPGLRGVLCLFEGVATGAADGYGRMAGRPAATLLHLGPGLGNGLANLHNAQRGHTPLVNIVGDHATFHLQYNAPLTADIHAIAGAVSSWVRSCRDAAGVPYDAAEAIAAARRAPGGVATLILPADCAWNESGPPVPVPHVAGPALVDAQVVEQAAAILRRGEPAALIIGGPAMLEAGQLLAARIGRATGARVIAARVSARAQHGAGRPVVPRIPYPPPQALALLHGLQHVILAGAERPVAFFGYPDTPSVLTPPDCAVHTLATVEQDVIGALQALADAVHAPADPGPVAQLARPPLPTGDLDPEKIWRSLAALLPEGAIISDEAVTAGRGADVWIAGAPPHDWLHITGGSIGQGLPVATGAAVACPGRKVFAMEADGSAMYTLQALWTQARERLDVVTVLFNNRAYAILQGELQRVGAGAPGPQAEAMLDLGDPDIDWVKLAQGMGVHATRARTAEEFSRQLAVAVREPGPHLIEAVIV